MKSALPKVLHPVCGRPMISWVVDQALSLDPVEVIVVVGVGAEAVQAQLEAGPGADRIKVVVQAEQKGTGHAVQVAAEAIAPDSDSVVVLYGDMPVLRPESLALLCEARQQAGPGGMAMLTAEVPEARGFGRIKRDGEGRFLGVVEEQDCSPEELEIDEVNLGVYAFPRAELVECLPKLESQNAQGEYYLTDVPVLLAGAGHEVATLLLEDLDEGIGVNTIAHLAEARWALQARILEEHMERGVYIEDPASTYVDHGVEIGAGTHLLPCTVIRSGVSIGKGCEVGPFTHLRKGTRLEDGAEVGNFTECKQSQVGAGAKAKHLSYLGDAVIGAGANIGAGTIFANYDGKTKRSCVVGEKAFVGSGTILVAPSEVGPGATTGAGAVLTKGRKIPAGDTWVGVPARELAPSSPASRSASQATAGDDRPQEA